MGRPVAPRRLDAAMLQAGCAELATSDARLGALLDRNGFPPLRLRPQGFATLVHLMLQQQVSRASANAVFGRLEALLGAVTPEALCRADPDDLRRVGFSQQKVEYALGLATAIAEGELDIEALNRLEDEEAVTALTAYRGIGPWTASVYVLTALGRPDVWAPGDRALLVSMGRMLGRPQAVPNDEAAEIAKGWSPWRALAARILWHDYAAWESL